MSDVMLYEKHFINMERVRWSLSKDLDFSTAQPDLLPDGLLEELRLICLTEMSALYANEMFVRDFYSQTDFSCFISIWQYEELKHFLTIKKYINQGGVYLPDIDTELPKLRLTFEPGNSQENTLAMHLVGEHRLAYFYTCFSRSFPDPLLKKIFKLLAADELRHGNAYQSYLLAATRKNQQALRDALTMGLFMLRSSNSRPKHPTNITKPSVMDMLEDPEYLNKMLEKYVPHYDETKMRQVVLANLGQLAGRKLYTERDLIVVLRELPAPDKELVGTKPL